MASRFMNAIAAVLLTALAQGQSVRVTFQAQEVIEKRLGAYYQTSKLLMAYLGRAGPETQLNFRRGIVVF
jgi:hypothetical protein